MKSFPITNTSGKHTGGKKIKLSTVSGSQRNSCPCQIISSATLQHLQHTFYLAKWRLRSNVPCKALWRLESSISYVLEQRWEGERNRKNQRLRRFLFMFLIRDRLPERSPHRPDEEALPSRRGGLLPKRMRLSLRAVSFPRRGVLGQYLRFLFLILKVAEFYFGS